MPDRSKITIEDVAAAAGVSVATVSRALRGLPNVAPATRQQVLAVAERLDYRPDRNASRLAAGSTRTVAVAVPMLNAWYFSQVLAGVEAVLKEEGYDLLVHGVSDEEARRRFVAGRSPIGQRVDGMVLVDLRVLPDEAEALAADGVVATTIGFRTPVFPSVTIDDTAIARLAVEYLLDLGHRRIGLIAGVADDVLRFMVPDRRRSGYLDALNSAGAEIDPALEVAGDFSVDGGRDAMAALMKSDNPPTAVFAMSDEMAFGALQTARELGLKVPNDVAIVGVDDHDLAEVLNLTTVKQRVVDHGAVAARMLINTLNDGSTAAPEHYDASFELVIRGTTAPLSS